ncbi:MAG: phytanoyl-CoA dioxygenase family protein [Pseudomonadota bacterium]
MLTHAQIQQFKIDGYLLIKSLLDEAHLRELKGIVDQHLHDRIEPFELEAEVQYPGAPKSQSAEGGATIRRLRDAYERHPAFAALAQLPAVTKSIQQILDCNEIWLNPNHHNCIMTKQPSYSSETLWHRDTRYWHFDNKYLVNSWLAIGDELQENGAMKILPGSHRWEVADQALDEAQFLILDHEDNAARLATARVVELAAGDLLLFSAHCFHAAGRNQTADPKFSLVFTYHGEETAPIPDTHSASTEEVRVL